MPRRGRPAPPRLFQVVRLVDLEPILVEAGCGASFEYRIEIRREVGRRRFVSAVYRRETFRLTPTFPVGPTDGADQSLFVPDPYWEPIEGPTVESVVRRAVARIAETFGLYGRGPRVTAPVPARPATRRPSPGRP